MRIVTFDVEVAKDPLSLPNGWEDARKGLAGISSVVVYDNTTERYHIYGPAVRKVGGRFEQIIPGFSGSLGELIGHLNDADILVGFNNRDFDTPALTNHLECQIRPPQIDLLQMVWTAVGKKYKGWGLGPICERTLGIGKSGDGEHAPKLFQDGRFYELIDYNLNDVLLTRKLFNHILDEQFVIGPDGEKVKLTLPEDMDYA